MVFISVVGCRFRKSYLLWLLNVWKLLRCNDLVSWLSLSRLLCCVVCVNILCDVIWWFFLLCVCSDV